jgi:acetyltransferase-like isoleucine patch superfamily enzyme
VGILGRVYRRCKFSFFFRANIIFNHYNISISEKSELNTYSSSTIEFLGSVNIGRYVLIDAYESCFITIGDNVYLGDFSIVRGTRCKINVGDNCIIGQGVQLIATNHKYLDKTVLVKEQDIDIEKNGISIGKDCWIGSGSCILPGVCIGDGAVIGAHSVITKNVKSYSVVVGNPGKQIKVRQ